MTNEIFTNNKIYNHLDKVIEWLNNGTTVPVCAEIDLTNLCNLSCVECIGYKDNLVSIDKNKAEDIIIQLKNHGVKSLSFTGGGEPTLHKDYVNIIKKSKELGFENALITNGINIDKKDMYTLLDCCSWIHFSFDAHNRVSYQKNKGKDYFNKVCNNIDLLTKQKRHMLKKECIIGVGYLTNKINNKYLEDIANLSFVLGVDYVQYRPFHHNKNKITEDQIDRIRFLFKDTNFKVLYSKHKYNNMNKKCQYSICHGHHFTTVIGADQKIYLCCHMRSNPKYELGDLTKQSFIDIWNSKKRSDIYENINYKDCIPLCRADHFNWLLDNIKQSQGQMHKNFL